MTYRKVEGFSNLAKDPSSGGVVNIDKASYERHILQKNLLKKKIIQEKVAQDKVDNLQEEINTIKNDLCDIRSLLVQLLQKGKPDGCN